MPKVRGCLDSKNLYYHRPSQPHFPGRIFPRWVYEMMFHVANIQAEVKAGLVKNG